MDYHMRSNWRCVNVLSCSEWDIDNEKFEYVHALYCDKLTGVGEAISMVSKM